MNMSVVRREHSCQRVSSESAVGVYRNVRATPPQVVEICLRGHP